MLGNGEGESRGRVVECGQVEHRLFPRSLNEHRHVDDGHGGQNATNSLHAEATHGNDSSALNPGHDDQASSSEDESLPESNGVPLPQAYTDLSSPPDQTGQQQQQPTSTTTTSETTTPRQAGLLRARQREMVRQAARRGIAFGFSINVKDQSGSFPPHGEIKEEEERERPRRKVEAVQRGRVVESSFAKGEWGVRWP